MMIGRFGFHFSVKFVRRALQIADGSTDGEKLSWLIVRHVYEIVAAAASGDPVMQDLVSAVHRNSGASVLFLQALQCARGSEAKWREVRTFV